jgi:Protein of unknown function (DUF5818)
VSPGQETGRGDTSVQMHVTRGVRLVTMMIGSTLLVALGATACGDRDEAVGVHAPAQEGPGSTPSSVEQRSGTPSTTDAEPPLRRPKPGVPLSVTPPPIKPQSGPTEAARSITVTGTLAEPLRGCLVVEADDGRWELAGALPGGHDVGDRVEVTGTPAPEAEGACGAPVIRVRDVRPA